MDENTQAKFAEKIKELLNMAKKKKNVLEYQEINDFFKGITLNNEQMDLIFEYLEAFYNTKRIHSHCDYMSPNDYEELYRRVQQHELLMAG